MGLQMPKSLKLDNPGATLRPGGREPFVAVIEPVRMSKTADATVESGSMPQRLAVDGCSKETLEFLRSPHVTVFSSSFLALGIAETDCDRLPAFTGGSGNDGVQKMLPNP
jgi:hypothetical protein